MSVVGQKVKIRFLTDDFELKFNHPGFLTFLEMTEILEENESQHLNYLNNLGQRFNPKATPGSVFIHTVYNGMKLC